MSHRSAPWVRVLRLARRAWTLVLELDRRTAVRAREIVSLK